jgi:hypothetical protein
MAVLRAPVLCGDHPTETIDGTCTRCGRWICAQCRADADGLCRTCRARVGHEMVANGVDLIAIRLMIETGVYALVTVLLAFSFEARSAAQNLQAIPVAAAGALMTLLTGRAAFALTRRRVRGVRMLEVQQLAGITAGLLLGFYLAVQIDDTNLVEIVAGGVTLLFYGGVGLTMRAYLRRSKIAQRYLNR